MLVLGIDPGIGTTGVAIIKEEKGEHLLLYSSAVTTLKTDSASIRLLKLYQSLLLLIEKYHPEVAALETLFFSTNVTNAFSVGQARGVVILALCQNNIPVFDYNPTQVKMALTGYGRADKPQIQQMIKTILKLPKILTPDDVADAAAIALTHLFSYKLSKFKMQNAK